MRVKFLTIALGMATLAAPAALSADKSFTLTNNGAYTINAMFVGAASQPGWQPIALSATINAGASIAVTVNDGLQDCVYDVYTRYAEGFDGIQEGVNICAAGVTINTSNEMSPDFASSGRGTP